MRAAEVAARALARADQTAAKLAPILEPYRDKHRGQECLILGNGPSLLRYDLASIPSNVVTIGLNASWRVYEEPTYHVCIDDGPHYRGLGLKPEDLANVPAEDLGKIKHMGGGQQWFNAAAAKGKLFCSAAWPNGIHLHFSYHARWPERFSSDIAACGVVVSIEGCGSVLYVALQLATFMGFGRIWIVGMDQTNLKFTGQKANADQQERLFKHTPTWARKRVSVIEPSRTQTFEVTKWPW